MYVHAQSGEIMYVESALNPVAEAGEAACIPPLRPGRGPVLGTHEKVTEREFRRQMAGIWYDSRLAGRLDDCL